MKKKKKVKSFLVTCWCDVCHQKLTRLKHADEIKDIDFQSFFFFFFTRIALVSNGKVMCDPKSKIFGQIFQFDLT